MLILILVNLICHFLSLLLKIRVALRGQAEVESAC